MNEITFGSWEAIKIDRNTGRIAMHWGRWYDDTDPLPHVGKQREEAQQMIDDAIGSEQFPHFNGGYTVTSGLLSSQHLIVVICTPKRGLARVSDEEMQWLDENSIL